MNIVKYFLLISVICFEVFLASTDFWVFTYFSPIIITASYYLLVKKENYALILLILGTFVVDFLNSRNIGLLAFSFLLSLLIIEVISRQIAIIDNQSRIVKIILTVVMYIVVYFGQMNIRNILSINQITILATIYLSTLLCTIFIVKTFNKTQKNVIKI